jgi:hemoglobin
MNRMIYAIIAMLVGTILFAIGLGGVVYRLAGQLGILRKEFEAFQAEFHEKLQTESDLDRIVAGPPKVRGDSIRDWLQHYTSGQYSWSDGVALFYDVLLGDELVKPYFEGINLDRQRRHLTSIMKTLTSDGISRRMLNRMHRAHIKVQAPDGTPITGEVYDRVIDALVFVLKTAGVPHNAISELGGMVAPLKAEIVPLESVR